VKIFDRQYTYLEIRMGVIRRVTQVSFLDLSYSFADFHAPKCQELGGFKVDQVNIGVEHAIHCGPSFRTG
jgi:hypothetical protein